MKKNKILMTAFTAVVAVGLLFGLAACGSDDAPAATPTPAATPDAVVEIEVEEDVYVDVYEDLQYVLAVVSENLEWGGIVWAQIMLADDVPGPEMKYGLLVVPFFPSDLTARHTRTVDISGGNFVIQITSADTGIIWSIDQDGNITRVN